MGQNEAIRQEPVSDEFIEKKFRSFFVSPKEKFVCSLGNGYIQNFIANGFVNKGFAVVSDKRVYFNGKTYEVRNTKLKALSESKTVDLKDVTGTGVRSIKYPLLWIMAIVAFVLMVAISVVVLSIFFPGEFAGAVFSNLFFIGPFLFSPAIIFCFLWYYLRKKVFLIFLAVTSIAGFIGVIALDNAAFETSSAVFFDIFLFVPSAILLFCYYKTRITLLTISYAGGCIAFNINWYSKEESDGFQKKLRIAKDKAVEEAENATANAMREVFGVAAPPVQAVQNAQPQAAASSVDELMKYAQLFKDGLITEEEFAAIKAKML